MACLAVLICSTAVYSQGGGCQIQSVDFNDYSIDSYDSNQDIGMDYTVQDNGTTLLVQDNSWASIDINYNYTSETVLRFEFKSTEQGERHAIAFDNDDDVSNSLDQIFMLYGTETGDSYNNYLNYPGNGEWVTYEIPVGQVFTGSFPKLIFVADEDVSNPSVNSYFRNIEFIEGDGEPCTLDNGFEGILEECECVPKPQCPAIDFDDYFIAPYGLSANQDEGDYSVQEGGASLMIVQNAWKRIAFNYNVTANTIMDFEFKSTAEGEIHAIGLDTDDDQTSNYTFALFGTQSNFGVQDFNNYALADDWKEYSIPVGNYYTGSRSRLFFVGDDDDAPQDANSFFRSVKIYEDGECYPDCQPPEFSSCTAPQTLVADVNGQATASFEAQATGTDVVIEYTYNGQPISSPATFGIGTHHIVATATNECGAAMSDCITIIVEDQTPPDAQCQGTTVQIDQDNPSVDVAATDLDAGSTDAAGIASITFGDGSATKTFSCSEVGSNSVELLITDNNGNSATCTTSVDVEDHTIVASCQAVELQLDPSGQASLTPAMVDDGSSESCDGSPGVSSMEISQEEFSCADRGANDVTLTVYNQYGESNSCTVSVTVLDEVVDPNMQCQDITLELGEDGTASISPADVDNGSSANCGELSLSIDKSDFDCSDLSSPSEPAPSIDDLFISEYIEGSSFNKCIEVYNGTGQSIDLAAEGYEVSFYSNGSISPNSSFILTGSVADGDVYVVCDDGASSSFTDEADQLPNQSFFNGNDAVELSKNGTAIDVIGEIGNDPGSEWGSGSTSTQNNTLVRKPDVLQGDSDGSDTFDPSVEWNGFSEDDNSNLGSHTVNVPPPAGGPVQVTLTGTDDTGNSATCTANVTVVDNVAPEAICSNVTVQLDETGNAIIDPSDVDNGSNDACGDVTLSLDQTEFDCNDVGPNTVTLTVTDASGNSATCSATVTVEDNESPDAVCQDLIVQLDGSGTASITAQDVDGGSSDNCGIASMSIDKSTFGCGDVSSESSGNPQSIWINEFHYDNDGTDTGEFIEVVANFDASSYELVRYNGANGDPYGTDALGSPAGSEAGFNIYVVNYPSNGLQNGNDGIALVDESDNVVEFISYDGAFTAASGPAAGQSADDIGVVETGGELGKSLQLTGSGLERSDFSWAEESAETPGALNNGQTIESAGGGVQVTLTVTDVNGNTSTCTANVTVQDVDPPVAACQDITVQLDENGQASITAGDIDAGSTDNCGVESLAIDKDSFDCSDIPEEAPSAELAWINEIHYDNDGGDTGEFVEVVANFDASAYSLQPYNGSNGQTDGSPASLGSAQSTTSGYNVYSVAISGLQNGSPDGVALLDENGSVVEFISYEGSFTASDGPAAGATSTDIGVEESSSTPVGQSLQLTGSGTTASDFTWSGPSDDSPGSINAGQTITAGAGTPVTLTVTDVNGNTSTCVANVTVEDNVAPDAVCKENLTVSLDASGNASITAADVDDGSTDACGIESMELDKSSFNCADVGENTVTLTVTDVNGNEATCSTTVTVEDATAPTAVCQDITVQLGAGGTATIDASDIDDGSSDACGIASLALDNTSFTCADIGANTVTLTVTDNNGNASTCTSTVTIEDNIAPEALCQDITVQLDENGATSIIASDIDNGSNDACGIASLSIDKTSFTCSDVGGNTVTLTVTDNNGNSSTCLATVTVEDNEAPVAVCQDVTVQLDANGTASIGAADIDGGSSDACGIASLVADKTDFTCADVGANTVTLTVTDLNGNASTCTATVTVEDNEAPEAVCQDITIGLDSNGNASITAADVDGGSSDNCGIASLAIDQDSFGCADVGTNNVQLTVTDVNGNSDVCTAVVTVEDNVAPVAVSQDITIQLDASGSAGIVPGDVDDGSSDACGIASSSVSPNSFDCSDVGDNTVTLSVTDVNGNSSSTSAVVTVEDVTPPTASAQDITAMVDASGEATITAAEVDAGSSDACGIASVSIDQTSFSCPGVADVEVVTLTVTDSNGNTSTAQANVSFSGTDSDGDGLFDACDTCPFDPDNDADGDGVCGDVDGCPNTPNTDIELNFQYLGSGEYCWVTDGNVDYINSWCLESLVINGVDYTNQYSFYLPPRIDGKYFIHFESDVPWGFFKIVGEPNDNNDCSEPVSIDLPYSKDGVGQYCWVTDGNIDYVSSWGMDVVEINGVDYTNDFSFSMPPKIDGQYEIYYEAQLPWAHLEIAGTSPSDDNSCSNPVAIDVPFSQDGTGQYCWITTDNISSINSWGLDKLEINGEDYTNFWSCNLPPKIDGAYEIYYEASVPWAHFEANAPWWGLTTDDDGMVESQNNYDQQENDHGSQSGVSSVANISLEERVHIFPNPTDDLFNVVISKVDDERIRLVLSDLSGKTVDEHQVANTNSEIRHSFDLGELPSGYYILQVITENGNSRHKVMKY